MSRDSIAALTVVLATTVLRFQLPLDLEAPGAKGCCSKCGGKRADVRRPEMPTKLRFE